MEKLVPKKLSPKKLAKTSEENLVNLDSSQPLSQLMPVCLSPSLCALSPSLPLLASSLSLCPSLLSLCLSHKPLCPVSLSPSPPPLQPTPREEATSITCHSLFSYALLCRLCPGPTRCSGIPSTPPRYLIPMCVIVCMCTHTITITHTHTHTHTHTDTFYLGKDVNGGEENTEEHNSQGVRAGAEEEAERGKVEEPALLKPSNVRAVASCLGGRGGGILPNACFTYRMPYKWDKGECG